MANRAVVGGRRPWAGRASRSGIGPSHQPGHRGRPMASPTPTRAATPRSTCTSLTALLRGEAVRLRRRRVPASTPARRRPRRTRRCRCCRRRSPPACCGSPASRPTARSCGWGTRGAIEDHVAPRIRAAADGGRTARAAHRGRPPGRRARRRRRGPRPPRPAVRGLRRAAQLPPPARHRRSRRPRRRRHRGRRSRGRPRRSQALFDAGATDVWAAMFPVGDDRSASRARTRTLLRELAARP